LVASYFMLSTYGSGGDLHYRFRTTISTLGEAEVTREINIQTDGDRSSYVIALRVKEGKGDIEVRESIPKSLAESVEDISFETEPAAVIKDDPVVMWRLKPKKDGTSIIYRVQVSEKMITKESFDKIVKDYNDLPKLDSINITPEIESISEGQAVSLVAIGIMSDESSATLVKRKWTSFDPEIATIDQSGELTGIKAGNVKISVSSGDISTSIEITVLPLLSEIVIIPKEHSLQAGQTVKLTVSGKFTDGSEKEISVGWSSSDPGIGTIDANGLFRAISAGKVTITCRSKGKEASSSITVTAPAVRKPTGTGRRDQIPITDGLPMPKNTELGGQDPPPENPVTFGN